MNQEAQIEKQFIEKLQSLGYTYRNDIHNKETLEKNFREKFERLNMVSLSDNEFERLKEEIVTPDVFKASKLLRTKQTFIREDGTPLVYSLVNLRDWCKNDYEVVNQLKINTSNSYHRYDVVILVNGLPLVQMELKSHRISPLKAVEQIVEYKRDRGSGYTNSLMCFIQLFMASNGETDTIYFANNNDEHFQFDGANSYLPVYNAALRDNKKVVNLFEFSDLMLCKCALGRLISRYMVLVETEQKLLVMRPYQIYAVEDIIETVSNGKGNGYIWHTTGSGKTLTSFKASTLLKDNPAIDKCIFVVDRKDLDKQTREEFNKFQAGCVEQNENTRALVYRLLSDDYSDKVIVTTIQKLGLALDPSASNPYRDQLGIIADKRVVFIFDECHRSQFGENRKAIENFFPNAQLFGFTGTPIFEENSNYTRIDGTQACRVTTKDVFQRSLHEYTITHAIQDRNVLRFNVEYYGLNHDGVRTQELPSPCQIVENILDIHNKVTASRRFNALFATSSIPEAIDYYALFQQAQQRRIEADPDYEPLNITAVFTPPYYKYDQDDLSQEASDNQTNPDNNKERLKHIIEDYNAQFGTSHSVELFDEFYKDVQQRIKDQKHPNNAKLGITHANKLDIVIVVDMMLTGFDSKFLNTLYVDKNLRWHGLIQAFSRTNRILDGTKPYGNIICYRDLQSATDEAMLLFSGFHDITKAKEYWIVEPVDVVLKRYQEKVQTLGAVMNGMGLDCRPEEVVNIPDGENASEFVEAFKDVQRLRLRLDQYVGLPDEVQQAIDDTLPEDTLDSFRTAYLDMARRRREPIIIDPEFPDPEPDYELSLFSSALIDYDYIMKLLARFTGTKKTKMKLTKEQLLALLSQKSNLMDEREYLAAFIEEEVEQGSGLTEEEIRERYEQFKDKRICSQIADIADRYSLDAQMLDTFVRESVRLKRIDEDVLSSMFASLGWKDRKHAKEGLISDLKPLLDRLTLGEKIEGVSAYFKE